MKKNYLKNRNYLTIYIAVSINILLFFTALGKLQNYKKALKLKENEESLVWKALIRNMYQINTRLNTLDLFNSNDSFGLIYVFSEDECSKCIIQDKEILDEWINKLFPTINQNMNGIT